MTNNEVVRELRPWMDARLRCGIGHTYRGRVRVVQRIAYDMDGEALWLPFTQEFDPDTCVVCGLKTYGELPTMTDPTVPPLSAPVSEVWERVKEYLAVGGLWNPELLSHDKVRDLLLDIQTAHEQEIAAKDKALTVAYEHVAAERAKLNHARARLSEVTAERDETQDVSALFESVLMMLGIPSYDPSYFDADGNWSWSGLRPAIDKYRATLKADQERMREALKDVVPMNWCDPMLTGPEAVLGKPYTYDGGDIERLLLAIKARLDAALSTPRQP